MVGFPGEAPDDFQRTLQVIESAGFTGLHVFRFSARPRTAAARYEEKVSDHEGRERSRLAISLGQRLKADYEGRFVGRHLDVVWISATLTTSRRSALPRRWRSSPRVDHDLGIFWPIG